METTASEKEIEAARAYESLHVPALFGQFAPLVAAAAGVGPGQRVLDVACGTGVLAREVACRTGRDGRVAGLDLSPGMLAVAGRLAPSIDWRQGSAAALPFHDGSFDALVSQFGLMFFPDRPVAVREMLRVLVAGGRIAVAVWDALERAPAYADEVALLERFAGRAAADALRAPFVLGDRDALARLFADAGFTAVRVATHRGTARFPSVRTMVEADLRGWLPVIGIPLDDHTIATVLNEAEPVLSKYVTATGSVAFDIAAHVVTGTKP